MKRQYFCGWLVALVMLVPVSVMAKDDRYGCCSKPVCHKDKPYKGDGGKFDYIIVGFGSAGAILARRLSDGNKNSVLVLEAGPNNMEDPATLNPNPFGNFADLLKITFNPDFASGYPIPVPNTFTGITYSEGRGWGGSAATNYVADVRGVPADYDAWAADSGNAQWLYSNLLLKMKLLETYTPNMTVANPAQRGFGGPISVTQTLPVDTNPLAMAIASETGSPFVTDYNDATLSNVNTNSLQTFATPGSMSRRSFSAFEFMTIGQIMDEKGRGLNGRKVRVKGNAVVARILFKGNTAKGVEYLRNKPSKKNEQCKQVYAKKQVILCAGSINSPKICVMSGVGPAAMVNDIGVKLVVDSPHMGQNLQNHYGPTAVVTNGTPAAGSLQAFINASPFMPADDVRRVQILAGNVPGGITTLVGFMLHPLSRGSIEVVSKDPLISAKVNLNVYDPATGQDDFTVPGTDAYITVSYLKLVQDIAMAAGEIVLFPAPSQYAGGDAALYQAATSPSALTIASHITGTARMGTDISNSAVDGNLYVHGTRHLMIADNSVASRIISGNTCWQAYMIGLVAVESLGLSVPPVL